MGGFDVRKGALGLHDGSVNDWDWEIVALHTRTVNMGKKSGDVTPSRPKYFEARLLSMGE